MKRLVILLLFALPLIAQEHGTTFALADGTKIYYETLGGGSGTPLILVNGGPGFDHMYFHVSNVWDPLAKNRRDRSPCARAASARRTRTSTSSPRRLSSGS